VACIYSEGTFRVCGGYQFGTLSHNGYADDSDCTWILSPDFNEPTGITFSITVDWFHVESGWDFVYIYDSNGIDGTKLLATLTSTVSTGTIYTSTSGYLTIYFSSDYAYDEEGFAFTALTATSDAYCQQFATNISTCIAAPSCAGELQSICDYCSSASDCQLSASDCEKSCDARYNAGNLTDSSGIITVGGTNDSYLDEQACLWLLQTNETINGTLVVSVRFQFFDLDSGDTLTLYDGRTTDSVVLLALSSLSSPGSHRYTSSGDMLIVFSSSSMDHAGGFNISYEVHSPLEECMDIYREDDCHKWADGQGCRYCGVTCMPAYFDCPHCPFHDDSFMGCRTGLFLTHSNPKPYFCSFTMTARDIEAESELVWYISTMNSSFSSNGDFLRFRDARSEWC